MSIDLIQMWHERARPSPTHEQFGVQLGCHFEEVAEQIAVIESEDVTVNNLINATHLMMLRLSDALKAGGDVYVNNRDEFLDSIADQIVTGVGVGHCAKMKVAEAVRRVNTSNWSKFDNDGNPIFNESGKISKGPNYTPPDLTGLC